MSLTIHSDPVQSHISRVPTPSTASTASTASATSQSTEAPSFSAIFAQMAASAAAAGTTVASVAPAPGGAAASQTPATAAGTTTTAATTTASATQAAADTASDPAGPLFGANPWVADPTGSGPDNSVTNYNPIYFATQQTAQVVAQMVGGTVVQSDQFTNAPGSPFQQDQPNYMVQLPNGGQINPGLVADIYTHGWNQSFVTQQVDNEVAGATPPLST